MLAVLAINIVIAYSVFLPAAAGLLNLGAAAEVAVQPFLLAGLELAGLKVVAGGACGCTSEGGAGGSLVGLLLVSFRCRTAACRTRRR